MQKTVVALYENLDDAQQSVHDLVDSGLQRDQISLVANDSTGQFGENIGSTSEPSGATQGAGVGAGIGAALGGVGGLLVGLGALAIPGIGPVLAAGPLAAAIGGVAGAGAGAIAGGAAGGLIGGLTDMGVSDQQAGYFAEGVRRGGTLVTVRTDDVTTERAKDVMNRHHPIDVNERAGEWRQSGWTSFNSAGQPSPTMDPNAVTGSVNVPGPVSNTNIDHMASAAPDIPSDVNERAGEWSQSGWTNTNPADQPSHTEPNPVTGSVNVPGPVSNTNIDRTGPAASYTDAAMDEGQMGSTGMGAASIGDTSSPRSENPVPPTGTYRTGDYTGTIDGGGVVTGPITSPPSGMQVHDFDYYDVDFRNHYANTFGDKGYTFNQYMPAYRYGYDLAINRQYQAMDWTSLEPDARRYWEERHPGTWDEFKEAIYHAWMDVHDTMQ
jgi:hypothetical protein